MSNMKIELYGRNAELCSFEEGGGSLCFSFDTEQNGYISLGPITSRIAGTVCSIDIRKICDGEYIPHLILANMTIDLPRVKIQHGIAYHTEHDSSSPSELSLRERRLEKRVDALEEKIEELYNKIAGSRLFRSEP